MPKPDPMQIYTLGGSHKIAMECALETCERRIDNANANAKRVTNEALVSLNGRMRAILRDKKIDVPPGAKIHPSIDGSHIKVLMPPPDGPPPAPTEAPPADPPEDVHASDPASSAS